MKKIRDNDMPGNNMEIEEDMKHLKIDITFNDKENEQMGFA